jgi:hypothetical protein
VKLWSNIGRAKLGPHFDVTVCLLSLSVKQAISYSLNFYLTLLSYDSGV